MSTFGISPGVNVSEYDLTTTIAAVSTSIGGIAGIFAWGPVGQPMLISSEPNLVQVFGEPNSNCASTWFTASSFLGYSNNLYVVRCANTSANAVVNAAFNAIANIASANVANNIVPNANAFYNHGGYDPNVIYIGKYPGGLGNTLQVSICDSVNAYSSNVTTATTANLSFTIGSNVATAVFGNAVNASANAFVATVAIGDWLLVGNSSIGTQYLEITSATVASNSTNTTATVTFNEYYMVKYPWSSNTVQRYWEFWNSFGAAPIQTPFVANNNSNTAAVDGQHVVIIDNLGFITGTPGTVLETYQNVSRATDAVTPGGISNYYQNVISQNSNWAWSVNDRSGAVSNTSFNIVASTNYLPLTLNFVGGQDGFTESTVDLGTVATGYDQYQSGVNIDVNLLMQGKPIGGTTVSQNITCNNFNLAQYIIDNVVSKRLDCVAFITPDDGVVTSNPGNEPNALVAWINAVNRSTSYAVCDSGFKYMYDKYNDVYRYVPMNGDIAGLCARTDATRASWWSPAGLNRGQILNVVKLRYNPTKPARDILYPNAVNPVVSFPNQGVVLYGDKTMLGNPTSAFSRINVRRLFITVEKAIATSAKFSLFEFNDPFTQSQFVNLVTPYLRTVKGQRGITDFLVVCDSTNNTGAIIDAEQFVGDIYIKPARAINFIQLNFVAVGTDVAFTEVVGNFGGL